MTEAAAPAWCKVDDVKTFLGIKPADTIDDVALARACAAVEPFIERVRPDAFGVAQAEDGEPPAADVYFAALQLAGRLYSRRNSVAGVASFGEMGSAVYVARYDPDIERALRIGTYTRPRVG